MATEQAYAELPIEIRGLLDLAKATGANAYNPYSRYIVGAAVRTNGGQQFGGCFMENASFGLTICSEPAAILAANNAGFRDIEAIAIVGGNPEAPIGGPACTPCGRCRQILWEVAVINHRDIQIFCTNLEMNLVVSTNCKELLPLPWGPTF